MGTQATLSIQENKLKQERVDKLEKVGLKWYLADYGAQWNMMYGALCRYAQAKRDQDKNGRWDGHISTKYETDDEPALKLGVWINNQRTLYKNNKISQERLDKLEKLGLVWNARQNNRRSNTRTSG